MVVTLMTKVHTIMLTSTPISKWGTARKQCQQIMYSPLPLLRTALISIR